MRITIDLNGKPLLRAVEIEDIPTYSELALEFIAAKLPISQFRPNYYLGVGHFLSQSAPIIF
jgi:hypothetical protein